MSVGSNRLSALENSASKTAKALTRDPSLNVVMTRDEAFYNWETNTVGTPAYSGKLDDANGETEEGELAYAFRGLLDHECGHKVYTDCEALSEWLTAKEEAHGTEAAHRLQRLHNTFEDPQMEARWIDHHPGSQKYIAAKLRVTIRETGGAAPCDPEHRPFGFGGPAIGVFTAFGQAMLRIHHGFVTVGQVPPVIQYLLKVCEVEIAQGFEATTTQGCIEAAEAVWKKLCDLEDASEQQEGEGEGECLSGRQGEAGESESEAGEGEDQPGDDDSSGQEGDSPGSGSSGGSPGGEGSQGGAEGSEGEEGEGTKFSTGGPQQIGGEFEPGEEGQSGEEEGEEGEGAGSAAGDEEGAEGEGAPGESGEEDGGADQGGEGDGEGDEEADGGAGDSGPGADGGEDEEVGEGAGEGRDKASKGEWKPNAEDETEEEGGKGADYGGCGGKGGPEKEAVAQAIGGEFEDMPESGQVIANKALANPENRPYTVHPGCAKGDKVQTFDTFERSKGRVALPPLKKAAGPATAKLSAMLRSAVQTSRDTLAVGGLEEGAELDDDAMPSIALGIPDQRIYVDYFRRVDESAFVCVMVDCSGSMGDSKAQKSCPVHGATETKTDRCPKRDRYSGKRCGKRLKYSIASKAAYAAVTAAALHDALRLCQIPHAVLGHTCHYNRNWPSPYEAGYDEDKHGNPQMGLEESKFPKWSRHADTMNVIKMFVDAPGLGDDGAALPYITGEGANLDGEALLYAAQYAADKGIEADRIILLMISDGLPAGADDRALQGIFLQRTVDQIAHAGIEVYGIGIGIRSTSHRQKFAVYYPNERSTGGRAATGNLLIPPGGLSDGVLREMVALLARETGFSRRDMGD